MFELIVRILPEILTGVIGGIGSWLYFRTPKGKIEVSAAVLDKEIRSASFYQGLLDDATKRINDAIKAIEERDERIRSRDERIDHLILEIEKLTDELRKYKQLNGKAPDAIPL